MDAIIITLLVFILGCVIHLEREVAGIKVKVTCQGKNAANKKNHPRPKDNGGRGLDKIKNGGEVTCKTG